jgi:hypothetical protein
MLRRVDWYKFTDVSEMLDAFINKAIVLMMVAALPLKRQ